MILVAGLLETIFFVEMRFDNKQFEQNVQTSISSIEKLEKSLNLKGASKGLEDVNVAAKNCNMTPLSNAVETVKMRFSALEVMAMTALSNITNSALNAGKNIVSALTIDPIKTGFQEYETQINAVQTILANTQSKGTTIDQVNAALDELNKYADQTIYNFTEMTRNIGTFTAAGVDLDKSVTSIKGIANLAAASGSNAQQASTAMYQLSQAIAAGKVSLQDWNSVVNAGMGGQLFQDALKRTAEHFGVNMDAMIEKYGSFRASLTEGGWLTTEVLTETLTQLSGAYSEADLIAQGYTEEQAREITKLAKTALDAATKVKTFTQLWDTLKESVQSGWTQSWEIIIGDFEEAKELLTEVSNSLGNMVNASAEARNKMLQDWKELGGRTALIEAVRNAFEGVLNIVKPVKEAFRDVFPPITGEQLYNLTVGLQELTEKFKIGEETANNLKRTFKGVFALFDIGLQGIKALVGGFADLIGYVAPAGDGILGFTAGIGDFIVGIDEAIKSSDAFNKAIEGIGNFPELIKAGVELLMAFFDGVIDALSGIDVNVLVKGIAGIGLLSAIMLALSAVASLVPGAMIGVLGMGAVIAELALVLAAVGALAQIPGLEWLIGEGGKLLQGIGTAIGQFVGGIVGGFMSGVSSQFPQIGADLSAFMTNVQPFIEGATQLNPSMLDGVKALAETILILTAADILNGLTSWLTGGSSLSDFATQLVPFGEAMRDFSIAIAGMDGELVANAATAGRTLAEMASTLPNSGGVIGFFTGENDMNAFGAQLIPFGEAMMGFASAVQGLDADAVTNASIAGKAMAEMATTIPNSGGVVGFFAGENDMDAFGEQLIPFGEAMMLFSQAVRGLDANVIVESATAGKALIELANTVPNSGGVVGFFTGENDMGAFGENLVPFGKAMKSYSDAIAGIDVEAVTNSATAGKAVVELANTLPNTGGLVSWFTGDNDIASFGTSLVSFGKNFAQYSNYMKNVDANIVTATTNAATSIVELQKSLPKEGGWFSDDMTLSSFGSDMASFGSYFGNYYNSISGIDTTLLSSVITQTNRLVSMANGMVGLDTSGMTSFSSALTTLGENGVTGFINAFNNAESRVATAASSMLASFINGANAKKSELTTTFITLVQAVLTAINGKQGEFQTSGSTLMIKFIAGVRSKDGELRTAFTTTLSGAITSIKDYYGEFKSAGSYLVDGFCNGISENTWKAEAKARAMAAAAAEAAEDELDEHSPSKRFYGIGNFAGVGFINALIDNVSKAGKAGREIAKSSIDGLNDVISRIADYVDADMDVQPTIRPVLDLSAVEAGTGRLNTLFSRNQALSVSTGMNERISEMEVQNGESSSVGNTYQFTQNNYSPKALSRIDIYRQTKNQFSAMKGLVSNT